MISFVIPLYNEEENIELLYKELIKTIKKLKKPYEIIFVDDGSTDGSLPILKKLVTIDHHITIYSFRKNLGKAEVLTYAFAKAQGEYIVTLDADLQDKPENIPLLLYKFNEEWDVVSGWRKNRKDSLPKIISSRIFNYFVSKMFGLALHDYNCGLKAYKQVAAKNLRLYGGLHRFIPLIAFQQGFSVTEEVVEHQKRLYGKSKYSFSKLWTEIPDIFTMLFIIKYSKKPLHFFGVIGSILVCIGLAALLYLWGIQLSGQSIGRRPLLIISLSMILAGLQIFFSGFLADLIINISQRSQSQDFHAESYVKYVHLKK